MDSACSGMHHLASNDLTNMWHGIIAHAAQSCFLPFSFTAATSQKYFVLLTSS